MFSVFRVHGYICIVLLALAQNPTVNSEGLPHTKALSDYSMFHAKTNAEKCVTLIAE